MFSAVVKAAPGGQNLKKLYCAPGVRTAITSHKNNRQPKFSPTEAYNTFACKSTARQRPNPLDPLNPKPENPRT